MARIAVGGFQHETNTFAPIRAGFEAFERADGWPGLSRGPAMLEAVHGVHLPITGAIEALRAGGHDLVGLTWSSAVPCAHVTEDAFERIAGIFLEELDRAGRVDGIYLDLHGAMVCEHREDGEGELLGRIRAAVGPSVPIAVSLDLHANVTEAMVATSDVLDIYRTYPHVDMGATGARTAGHLQRMLREDRTWAKALAKPDFLIPLNFGCTDLEPARTLYGTTLPGLLAGEPGLRALGLALGFHLADIREIGPAAIAYGETPAIAEGAAHALAAAVHEREAEFGDRFWSPEAAVEEALRRVGTGRPVILADTADNPGGGGPGDTTALLRALIDGGARGSVIGVFNDPRSAARAHAAGVGASVGLDLGGKLYPGDAPVEVDARILALGDGCFTGIGPMWGGARFQLGPYALVEARGVRVVVASQPMQAGDRSMFLHVGVDPGKESIVALKSSVHFRADFAPIAAAILVVSGQGPVHPDPAALRFERARPGLRLRPRPRG